MKLSKEAVALFRAFAMDRTACRLNGEQARALGAACAEVLAAVPAVPCSCGCTEPFEERGRGWPECPACGMV